MKSRGSIWHFVKHTLPGLDVRSFCFRGNKDEAQSAIHIIRNQTPDLAGRRKWKRKANIHCLVIKSHFVRLPLLHRSSFLAIDKLLSTKWAQFGSKHMRHTYLTFSAKRKKQENKKATKLSKVSTCSLCLPPLPPAPLMIIISLVYVKCIGWVVY